MEHALWPLREISVKFEAIWEVRTTGRFSNVFARNVQNIGSPELGFDVYTLEAQMEACFEVRSDSRGAQVFG